MTTQEIPDYWEIAKTYLSKRDKTLGKIISEYNGEILTLRGNAFFTLARSIVGQQISVKAADSVWRKFESTIPALTPQATINTTEIAMRECGLSSSKIRYLFALSQYFIENEAAINSWKTLSDAELIRALTSINGIGRWTAEMFMIFHLARPDVFPIADIGLQKAIFRHYNAGNKLTTTQISEIAEIWQPYRTVATWYLWRSLDPTPVAY